MKLIIFILILIGFAVQASPDLRAELPVISRAAKRNGCAGDDFVLLCSIRMAENGRAGREFGVLHPKAMDTNLNTQAGWAAATIVKHHRRYGSDKVTVDFINSLADRYCPKECDADGNKNWKKNVSHWYEKLRDDK
jgi:hypothetical protein